MAKPKQVDRGQLVTNVPEKRNCQDCKKEYLANKMTYENGTIVITPPRCPECQTAHLTNIRVNKALKDLSLIGNLRARLTQEQRQAVMTALTNKLTETADRFAGTAIAASSFNIKRV